MRLYLNDSMTEPIVEGRQFAEWAAGSVYDGEEMEREQLYAVFLNRASRVIGYIVVGLGGIDYAPIDVRLVCRGALEANATGVILTHNHPSGDATPSQMDIRQTERLKEALHLFDILLLDHIIITANRDYYSFSTEYHGKF